MSRQRLTLDRILQSQGIGSRKYCRHLIRSGRVSVAGTTVENDKQSFALEQLQFAVDGQSWQFRENLYLALHKPADYECSRQPSHHPGVLRLLPDAFEARGVQPVGRLDHDTTGLLLMSDDGQFIHRQSSPRWHVDKVYQAQTAEPVTETLIQHLCQGVLLHDETEPLRALHCRQLGTNQLELVLQQGKYHQVKRMLAAAGNHCQALVRTQIGDLTLAELALKPGQWCYLDEVQLQKLTRRRMNET